ncbi:Hypothetical predicted protein [Prunus dulcis]|uniref:Uncharacterized protein n=1 Tax=Prunus dulcis TaxID=3755 RepID=A0A5E4G8N0_PRUDU|nr:Hypothetical predicted protein [Prunus dulcis]
MGVTKAKQRGRKSGRARRGEWRSGEGRAYRSPRSKAGTLRPGPKRFLSGRAAVGSRTGRVVEEKTGWFCNGTHSTSSLLGVGDRPGFVSASWRSTLNLILSESFSFELWSCGGSVKDIGMDSCSGWLCRCSLQ